MEIVHFEDDEGRIIESSQAETLSEYDKIFMVDGKYKKREAIYDHKLKAVFYNLSSGESVNDVILQYPSIIINIVVSENVINGYILQITHQYISGVMTSKSRHVENPVGQLIFGQEIDLYTEQPILKTTKKWFIVNVDNDFYEFTYAETGELVRMYSINPENSGDWRAGELDSLGSFSWSDVGDYYRHAEPVIPD